MTETWFLPGSSYWILWRMALATGQLVQSNPIASKGSTAKYHVGRLKLGRILKEMGLILSDIRPLFEALSYKYI